MAVGGERQAHARRDPALLGAVVGELAVALEPRGAERIVQELVAAAETDALAQRIVVAAFAGGVGRERPLPALGDDLDDAADGVGAVERRLGSADDLDPLDLVEAQVREVERPRRGTLHALAVDQDLDLLRARPTDADLAELARAALTLDLEARHLPERVVHRQVVVGLQLFFADHGHGRAHLRSRLRDLRRRHHHRIHLPQFLGRRAQDRARAHHRHDQHDSETLAHGFTPSSAKGWKQPGGRVS